MSYDFFMEVAAPDRLKRRKGIYPALASARTGLAKELLAQLDAEIEFDDQEELAEAQSSLLGRVIVEVNRISFTFSSTSSYPQILKVFHRVAGAFEPHGYHGFDPQLGDAIAWREDYFEFLRQFRKQFLCPDDEFEEWLQGREPHAWQRWRVLKERFAPVFQPGNFPRTGLALDWTQRKERSDAELWAALKALIAINDERLRQLELEEYVRESVRRGAMTVRRGNGDFIPHAMWRVRSSLDEERELLRDLQDRSFPAVLFDQPQLLTVVIKADPDASTWPAHHAASDAIRKTVRDHFSGSGSKVDWCTSCTIDVLTDTISIRCADVDEAERALRTLLKGHPWHSSLRMTRRYGDHGSREVQDPADPASSAAAS